MRLQLFMATLLGLSVTVLCQAPTPPAVRYIGVGYNLVKGNPEGGTLQNGGVDPGILPTRRILNLSYEEEHFTADRRFKVPYEVQFSPRQSCVTETSISVFSGGQSYQRQLSVGVTASASFLQLFSFTASSALQEIEEQSHRMGKVYCQTIVVCNKGQARYRDELGDKFSIADGFAADACRLPYDFNIEAYMNFLEDWGTHVILEVDVGTKTVERNESSLGEFVRYAMDNVKSSISFGGSFDGSSGSVSVDVDTFNGNMQQGTQFGSKTYRFTMGGQDLNEPVLKIPITWPRGTYGFPKADSGCPRDIWNTGYLYQDTEDAVPSNRWSTPLHLQADYDYNNIGYYFCMKTEAEEDSYNWPFPSGRYCVYKKGPCPDGLEEGSIHWDDENTLNQNKNRGVLPDGNYSDDTTISFCCRTDGYTALPIHLPTDKPFILLSNALRCQAVHGMNVSEEYFGWHTEAINNQDSSTGSTPTIPKIGSSWIRLTFCYYYKS
ncbi:hypothetical protein HOLleu_35640 [Holothuria leucospilota]|uniref:MACPF domain-containing protein n=1 Tax=Holothuria leucospilota TaxID=206669 RepID=A0A9Q0YJ94_HOLLE|nr:hypothetical protein HOLleu_35640 [Holothuria leucospilota]